MTFSVIIPTFKRIHLLKNAVESVLHQTFQNFELIVVNDNPNDIDAINDLFRTNSKIKIIHHQICKGGNSARNSGINESVGEFIAFLDDDDIWLPNKLEEHFMAHQKNPEAGLIFSDCLYIYNNKITNQKTSYNLPKNVVDAMSKAKFCPATSSMVSIKRACIKTCGLFDEELVSFQDWDYWYRIAHHYAFIHIRKILVHFIQHLGDRTSQNELIRKKGILQISEKWKEEIDVEIFSRSWMRIIYHKNSLNALLAGKKRTALHKSLKLLQKDVISFKSIKSFISLSLQLVFMKTKELSSR